MAGFSGYHETARQAAVSKYLAPPAYQYFNVAERVIVRRNSFRLERHDRVTCTTLAIVPTGEI
jgi:hypothetical protein